MVNTVKYQHVALPFKYTPLLPLYPPSYPSYPCTLSCYPRTLPPAPPTLIPSLLPLLPSYPSSYPCTVPSYLFYQAVELLERWALVDGADALELLSAAFTHVAVRDYAVAQLEKTDDEEVLLYLLQLVQALKYEPFVPSRELLGLLESYPDDSDDIYDELLSVWFSRGWEGMGGDGRGGEGTKGTRGVCMCVCVWGGGG